MCACATENKGWKEQWIQMGAGRVSFFAYLQAEIVNITYLPDGAPAGLIGVEGNGLLLPLPLLEKGIPCGSHIPLGSLPMASPWELFSSGFEPRTFGLQAERYINSAIETVGTCVPDHLTWVKNLPWEI